MIKLLYGDWLAKVKKIPNHSIDMVLADIPFGTTENKWDHIIDLPTMWNQIWRVSKPNSAVVLCASQPFTSILVCSQINHFKTEWVWSKNKGSGHLNAKKMPMKFHETLEVFYKKPPTYNPQMTSGHKKVSYKGNRSSSNNYNHVVPVDYNSSNKRHPRNILEIPVVNNDGTSSNECRLHSTQKPVALMEYMIKTYSNVGDTILDFTCGSGSTPVACDNTDRNCIAIDDGMYDGKIKWLHGLSWVNIARMRLEKIL